MDTWASHRSRVGGATPTPADLGNREVPLADKEKAAQLNQEYRRQLSGMLYDVLKEFGTAGTLDSSVRIGDPERYAFHVGGQEIAMHDPKYGPSHAGSYQGDPTPGRHTQCGLGSIEARGETPEGLPPMDKYTYTGKGFFEMMVKNMMHTINASGFCFLVASAVPQDALGKLISAATGWDFTLDEVLKAGEMIANMRQAFNTREGIVPRDFKIEGRPVGDPPLKEGSVANITVDPEILRTEYFMMSEWDLKTGKPSKKKLEDLGLHDVAKDLWPAPQS